MTLCECGCGGVAPLAAQSSTRSGTVKGQPQRFIVGHNQRTKQRRSGYRMVKADGHPRATSTGYVYEHVLIAERALGRVLPPDVEVHHVNEDSLDNRNANLVICEDCEYHNLLHVRARVFRAGGNPNTQRVCCDCRRPRDLSEFNVSRRNKNGGVTTRCRECNQAYCRKSAAA